MKDTADTEALKEDVIRAALRWMLSKDQTDIAVSAVHMHSAASALLVACPEYGDKDNV